MQIDDTTFEIINDISKKHNVDITVTSSIMNAFYKGIVDTIEKDKGIIKIPFFGKFIYSEAWKEKKDKLKLEFGKFKID